MGVEKVAETCERLLEEVFGKAPEASVSCGAWLREMLPPGRREIVWRCYLFWPWLVEVVADRRNDHLGLWVSGVFMPVSTWKARWFFVPLWEAKPASAISYWREDEKVVIHTLSSIAGAPKGREEYGIDEKNLERFLGELRERLGQMFPEAPTASEGGCAGMFAAPVVLITEPGNVYRAPVAKSILRWLVVAE